MQRLLTIFPALLCNAYALMHNYLTDEIVNFELMVSDVAKRVNPDYIYFVFYAFYSDVSVLFEY